MPPFNFRHSAIGNGPKIAMRMIEAPPGVLYRHAYIWADGTRARTRSLAMPMYSHMHRSTRTTALPPQRQWATPAPAQPEARARAIRATSIFPRRAPAEISQGPMALQLQAPGKGRCSQWNFKLHLAAIINSCIIYKISLYTQCYHAHPYQLACTICKYRGGGVLMSSNRSHYFALAFALTGTLLVFLLPPLP